jgi:hypothetical protein
MSAQVQVKLTSFARRVLLPIALTLGIAICYLVFLALLPGQEEPFCIQYASWPIGSAATPGETCQGNH